MLQNARFVKIVILKRFNREWLKQALRNNNNVAKVHITIKTVYVKHYTNYVIILSQHTGARN